MSIDKQVKSMPYVGAIAITNTLEYGRAPFGAVVAEESGIVTQCVNYFANKCGLTLDREFEKNCEACVELKIWYLSDNILGTTQESYEVCTLEPFSSCVKEVFYAAKFDDRDEIGFR